MRRKLAILLVLVAFVVASAGLGYSAEFANPDLILSAKQLKDKVDKPDWVVVDCRDLKDYAKGHIPGSISLGQRCKKALRDYTARLFEPDKYEKLLGKVGIGNDTHVVLYGEHEKTDTVRDSAVAFWIFEAMGHKKVHVLNGGIDDWINQGYPLSNEPTIKSAKNFKASPVASALATTAEAVQVAKGQKKGVQLIDSRSEDEHKGKDIRALRGGHIPNTTINVSHKETWDQVKDRESGKMKDNGYWSADRLESLFGKLDRAKRTIAYCQTGTRSAMTYFELRLMGFKDPANYDDSWIIYASHPDMYPVADEQWFDFARVRKLEKSLKKLEDKVAELSGGGDKKE
ncbi:MAG: sulfurtransferase [Thermodesulfovibrionales bacterium]